MTALMRAPDGLATALALFWVPAGEGKEEKQVQRQAGHSGNQQGHMVILDT
jgi:hypothetical protein